MLKEILMNEGVLSILFVLVFFGIAFFVQWITYKIKDYRESKRFWKQFHNRMEKRDRETNRIILLAIKETLPLVVNKLKQIPKDKDNNVH